MNKNFITCLDHIIDLEKTSIIQDKTLNSLQHEISQLGKSKQYTKPVRQEVYMPSVQYQTKSDRFEFDFVSTGGGICAAIFGFIGLIVGFATTDGFILRALGAVLTGGVGFLIGFVVGWVLGAIIGVVNSLAASDKNEQARKNAEKEAQRLYEEAQKNAEIQYQNEMAKYSNNLADDAQRVSAELKQKEILKEIYQQLYQKHKDTQKLLAKFYDKADIYVTYRNIIAMCHIAEYLKSGICTELTGLNGAFMVFKYEMYEKKKIEQLDTIISQLDQLHFDNQILNSSLQQINGRVSELIDVVGDVKRVQIENAQRNEQMVRDLGSQINSYAAQISSQNAIIAYNTECAANELNQLKWLETSKALS